MSRRDQIIMSPEEIRAFLVEQRTVICATNGHNGWPHLMPLWFVTREQDIWAWTFGKSQKVRNLERDPRATLQVEDGEQYDQLRGVMIEAHTVIHRETELVTDFGLELFGRYNDGDQGPEFKDAHPRPGRQARRPAVQARADRQLRPPQAAGAY